MSRFKARLVAPDRTMSLFSLPFSILLCFNLLMKEVDSFDFWILYSTQFLLLINENVIKGCLEVWLLKRKDLWLEGLAWACLPDTCPDYIATPHGWARCPHPLFLPKQQLFEPLLCCCFFLSPPAIRISVNIRGRTLWALKLPTELTWTGGSWRGCSLRACFGVEDVGKSTNNNICQQHLLQLEYRFIQHLSRFCHSLSTGNMPLRWVVIYTLKMRRYF